MSSGHLYSNRAAGCAAARDVGVTMCRFRTSLELGPDGVDGVPFARLFGRIVGANLRMMDRYLPGMLDVLGGGAPAEALADIDGNRAW